MNSDLKKMHARLMNLTKDCRDDMHEPDEQGLEAVVVGVGHNMTRGSFDNAMGDGPDTGELNLHIFRTGEKGEIVRSEYFNLASLVALARMADPSFEKPKSPTNRLDELHSRIITIEGRADGFASRFDQAEQRLKNLDEYLVRVKDATTAANEAFEKKMG